MTAPLRIVFFGTPDFAVPSLAALLDAELAVPLVVSQPDRPVGRHAGPRPSAVGAFAAARGIPVEKPETVRGNEALLGTLRAARPDAIAVVAFGRILPVEILRKRVNHGTNGQFVWGCPPLDLGYERGRREVLHMRDALDWVAVEAEDPFRTKCCRADNLRLQR